MMKNIEMQKYEDSEDTEVFPSGKLFRISYDATINKLRLKCFNRDDLNQIIDTFSDINPSSFFMKQYGYDVPSKISVINTFGYFSSGLLFTILKNIKLRHGSLQLVAMSDNLKKYIVDYLTPLKTCIKEEFEISNVSDDSGRNEELVKLGKGKYEFRDYQENSIKSILFKGYGKGMMSLPTSSGKSNILCNFIYNLQKHVNDKYQFLVMVPNKQLVSQMYNDFADYGYDKNLMSKFTAGLKKNEVYNPNAKVIIANRQYIFSNSKLLPKIDVLICDEVHQVAPNSQTEKYIIENEAKIKIGCSGSIPKEKFKRWSLIGIFGDVVYSEDITDLQRRGFITKLKLYKINIIDRNVESNRNYLFHINPIRKYNPDENGYSEIAFNAAHDAEHEYYGQYYKELYKPALDYISKFDENTLILFDRIEFGKRLTELSKDIFKDKKIHYIDGQVDVKDRLNIVNEMENGGNNVLFAEFATFSTGVNVKRLSNLVFVSSSKSFPRILQSVGRTLRLHNTKNEARIFDINFNFRYSRRHLKERLKIYQETYNKRPDEEITFNV